MGYNQDSLDKTSAILSLISQRQQALSSNIANMQTPGYLRQDVSFDQVLGSTVSPLETQLSKKLGPSPLTETQGEKISVQKEFMLMQKNLLFYSLAARDASSKIQNIKTVIQVGK